MLTESRNNNFKTFKKGVYLLKSGFVHDPQDNMDTNGQYQTVRAGAHHSMKAQLALSAVVLVT